MSILSFFDQTVSPFLLKYSTLYSLISVDLSNYSKLISKIPVNLSK